MIDEKVVRVVVVGLAILAVRGTLSCRAQTKAAQTSGQVEKQAVAKEQDIRTGVDPEILTVLDGLEKLGQTIRYLQAELSLEKLETLVDDRTIKEGRLYYQRQKEKIRFRISFEKTRYDRRSIKDAEGFVFADGWLTHRQSRSKRVDRYQITRTGQASADLMRIGKSPLPIPIGQQTQEVLKNFEVSLMEADEQIDPPGVETTHLKLVPREGTELAISHTRLEFWLRKADSVPVRSQWENDSGDIFTADMSKLQINKRIKKKVFKLPKLPSDYEIQEHPLPKEGNNIDKDQRLRRSKNTFSSND